MDIAKYVHTPDGRLVPERPYEIPGTKVVLARKDPDFGDEYTGSTGVITEDAAKFNAKMRVQKLSRCYASWTKPDGRLHGVDYMHSGSVDILEE